MRRRILSDMMAVARVLRAHPPHLRDDLCRDAFDKAHAADKFRKRFGRLHPAWGDGSLQGWAQPYAAPPAPRLDDREFLGCMATVIGEVIRRHS